MGLWEQAEVEEALGAELAVAIPELLRLAELEVRIPRLEVVALERLAERDGRSVDTLLARHLLDLVSAHSAWLSQVIPGFRGARVAVAGIGASVRAGTLARHPTSQGADRNASRHPTPTTIRSPGTSRMTNFRTVLELTSNELAAQSM